MTIKCGTGHRVELRDEWQSDLETIGRFSTGTTTQKVITVRKRTRQYQRNHRVADLSISLELCWCNGCNTICVLRNPIHVHYNGVIMGAMASQITSLTIAYSTVYSGADERKDQSSASLAFVWEIHRRLKETCGSAWRLLMAWHLLRANIFAIILVGWVGRWASWVPQCYDKHWTYHLESIFKK